jgi:hypothetical protein
MIQETLPAAECASECVRRHAAGSHLLDVIWVRVRGSRTAYCAELREAVSGHPIVPIVVEGAVFAYPNAVLSDLRTTLESSRSEFERISDSIRATGRVMIVLLSRSELGVAQLASPTILPDWFPLGGGEETHVIIEDITWKASIPLNAAEAKVPDLCEGILEAEDAVLQRLCSVNALNHNAGNALHELIRTGKDEKYHALLTAASEALAAVPNPGGYRPSARDGRTLMGRVLRLVTSTSPDGLYTAARALAMALDLADGVAVAPPMPAVLLRSVNRDAAPAVSAARSILVTFYSASQFVTAAAHADSYPTYPIPLVRAISYDLRVALRSIADACTPM